MKLKKYFSMIEILVGIVVLTIMMAFLINAFTTAERVASTGSKSMNLFEKSNMTLDFMASDVRQLIVSAAPRTSVSFTYGNVTAGDSTSLAFTGRPFFSETPGLTQAVNYSYDKATGELSRSINGAASEVLINKISFFSVEFYDENDSSFHDILTGPFTSLPNYCRITLKLSDENSAGTESLERAFVRRIYFE